MNIRGVQPGVHGLQILQHLLGQAQINWLVEQGRPGHQAIQGALQAAHVLVDVFGQILQDFDGDMDSPTLGFVVQDIDPGGEVRRADGRDEAAGEPGTQFLGEVPDLPRKKATRKHQTLILAHERIQGVADLRLDLLFAAEKLHFFQEQDVAVPPKALFEGRHPAILEGMHHFVGEIFSGDIHDLLPRRRLGDEIPHRLG